MDISSETFPKNVSKALADGQLQYAMTETGPRFIQKRSKARDGLPEFDALRDQARDIKDHVLEHLDIYLERYEAKVKDAGGHVHWADSNRQAMGLGHTASGPILQALKETGYRGYCSAEIFPLPDGDEAARQTMRSLKGA